MYYKYSRINYISEKILLYSLHAYIKTLKNRMYKGFYAFLSLHKVPQKPT